MAAIINFIVFVSFFVIQIEGSAPPAIGDIKLVKLDDTHYQVLVYFSDGIDKPEYRGICSDVEQTVGITICRQLGYPYRSSTGRDTGQSVWFTGSECDSSSSHILQCKHEVAPSDQKDPSICGPSQLTLVVNCDFDSELPKYDGELQLCASDNQTSDVDVKISVSYGLVRMFFVEHNTWRGINQFAALLGSVEANTICKQMGYTGAIPGSAVARSASSYTFDSCYKNDAIEPSAWMKTTDINCNKVPQDCLGCCYEYSAVFDNGCDICDQQHDIVIGCYFDTTKIELPTKGTQQDCTLNSDKKVSQCASESASSADSNQPVTVLAALFGILSFVNIIVVAILTIACIDYTCCKSTCRKTFIDYKRKICTGGKVKYEDVEDNNNA